MALRGRILLIAGFICWVFAWVQSHRVSMSTDLNKEVKVLESLVHKAENSFDTLTAQHELLFQYVQSGAGDSELKKLQKLPFTFFIHKYEPEAPKPELIFWTRNDVLARPPVGYPDACQHQIVSSQEMIYLSLEYPFIYKGENYLAMGMIPLWLKYPLKNEYLKTTFPLCPSLENYATASKDVGEVSVKHVSGDILFWLNSIKDTAEVKEKGGYLEAFLSFIGYLLILAGGYKLAAKFVRNAKSYVWSQILFLVGGFFIKLLYLQVINRHAFDALVVFQGNYLSQSYDMPDSAGAFFLNVVLLFVASFFCFRYAPEKVWTKVYVNRPIWLLLVYIIIGGMLFYINASLRHLILSVKISLSGTDILTFDYTALTTLLSLSFPFLAIFLIAGKLYAPVLESRHSWLLKIFLAAGVVLFYNFVFYGWIFIFSRTTVLLTSLFTFSFLLGYEAFLRAKTLSPAWLVTWLMLIGAYQSTLISSYNERSQKLMRRQFAESIVLERSLNLEASFKLVSDKIKNDGFIQNYISVPSNPLQPLQERIAAKYLDDLYFGDYEYEIHAFTGKGFGLLSEVQSVWSLEEQILLSQPTFSKGLYFRSHKNGWYDYIACVVLHEKDGSRAGMVYIVFKPKPELQRNLYLEILAPRKYEQTVLKTDLSFALFKQGKLVVSEGGQFSETIKSEFELGEKDSWKTVSIGEKTYLVYKGENGNVAVVGWDREVPVGAFSLFSFMFCFLLVITILCYVLASLIRLFPEQKTWLEFEKMGLSVKIQLTVLGSILVSFIVIAIATILINRQALFKYNQNRLERKVASAATSAGEQVAIEPFLFGSSSEVLRLANSIANTQRLTVNIFDLKGQLLQSSVNAFFDRRLLAPVMNPQAYYYLNTKLESYYQQLESVGNFKYYSAYTPIKDQFGNTLAYLQVPFETGDTNTSNRDAAVMLGTLLNVYVLLLITAALLAIMVARSITFPLTAIANKIVEVKLDRQNEPLDWHTDDEIGLLVSRYNEMIHQLENSATELAKTQKEMAWREMAKQVAHEIKNPLTPMKLNLQLLERAFQSDPQRAKEMYTRISGSLIEQIDNLARIASEFSNFAKMPLPQNEKFELNILVASVFDLFTVESSRVNIGLELPAGSFFIYADRQQVMRVLNNLIKNAIQAIPEDRNGKILIKLEVEGEKALVSVKDNGTGISEEKKTFIFVPNFTTKNSGTGLGLAMSKQIIEAADGRIWFESTENEGSTFFIEFKLV